MLVVIHKSATGGIFFACSTQIIFFYFFWQYWIYFWSLRIQYVWMLIVVCICGWWNEELINEVCVCVVCLCVCVYVSWCMCVCVCACVCGHIHFFQSVAFGIAHFHGTPGGPAGVVLTFIFALLMSLLRWCVRVCVCVWSKPCRTAN